MYNIHVLKVVLLKSFNKIIVPKQIQIEKELRLTEIIVKKRAQHPLAQNWNENENLNFKVMING